MTPPSSAGILISSTVAGRCKRKKSYACSHHRRGRHDRPQAHRAAGDGSRALRPAGREADADRYRCAGPPGGLFRPYQDPRSGPRRAGRGRKGDLRAARGDLSSRRRGLRRGRARFRQGLPRQSRRRAQPAGGDPQGGRRLQAEGRVLVVDGGVRRAVPACDSRRVQPDAAHVLRHAESDRRTDARRLHAPRHPAGRRHPAAFDRGAARQAEQGRLGLLLRHHPRAACRRRGRAAGCRKAWCTPMRARARRWAS